MFPFLRRRKGITIKANTGPKMLVGGPRKRVKRTPATEYRYAWALGEVTGVAVAYTRSEAKAFAKRELGIPRHRRLPMHFEIVRVAPVTVAA